MLLFLAFLLGACALGFAASVVFTRASGRSPLWNVGFAVVVVLIGAAVLLLTVVIAMRWFSP
jgi:hypothetical protein